ncbi:2-amino-4-hydroxy-6-hydroxymethyldihydropteridine diphosphokinase [Ruegeria faecimaris]|uniref:2-amino-4-hydroxy-6- hydroxymethyldihydropteridine diphosphokinase n=1 Tax=Ruegeria faecimaris TaxID=686389 RepID=UPI002493AB73|nr:2-amino-4-hydroxy-6-hydroxymethyldihydropteridine diphosphokinase [Ruegeria faecimaris]
MRKTNSKAVLALGANLKVRGFEPHLTLRHAIDAILRQGLLIRAESRFYATPCFPEGAGPDYVNAAVLIETERSPFELLQILHGIEHDYGRERIQRWGMRTLDLDLVCYDDLVLPDREVFQSWLSLPPEDQKQQAPDQLILPHPRVQDRAFVLVPMADVAPNWRHPILDQTVMEMLAGLPSDDIAAVTPL